MLSNGIAAKCYEENCGKTGVTLAVASDELYLH